MQFTSFLTTVAVLAMASTGLAACTYEEASYLSSCTPGDKLYCSGNNAFCSKGLKPSFDKFAVQANEQACDGAAAGTGCTQTACCS
ncbi:hypothetical protein BUE80_DR008178 [Diplocarpon rosae]|nr:hypothetical protein BUE80_DR008178 [Diplocarpon rosae]